MNDLQLKLYELLVNHDSVCRQCGIDYYLGGGSALGAVRHKGFLPWDDDVDLYITRDNYKKVREHSEEFKKVGLILVDKDIYPLYGNTVARLVDVNSTMITKARIVDGTPKGQFIEYFILDPMPVGDEEQFDWLQKHWIYAELLARTFKVVNKRIYKWTDMNVLRRYQDRVRKEGLLSVISELEKELFNIEEEGAEQYCSRWGLRNLIYDIDWFSKPKYIPFENTTLPVAEHAERVLRFDYGDSWMFIPEMNEQKTHTMAANDHIPYHYMMDDYLRFIDQDMVNSDYMNRKQALLENYEAMIESEKKLQSLWNHTIRLVLEYNNVNESDLKQLEKNGEFDKIEACFEEWYNKQFDSLFKDVKLYLDISDDLLYYAILPHVLSGEFSRMRELLIWHGLDEMSTKLKIVYDFLSDIRDAYTSLDEGDLNAAKHFLDKASSWEYAPKQFDYRYLVNVVSAMNADDQIELEYLKKQGQKLLDDYPGNGMVMSAIADICYKLKQYDEALRYYDSAGNNTRNGVTLMHINAIVSELKEDYIE